MFSHVSFYLGITIFQQNICHAPYTDSTQTWLITFISNNSFRLAVKTV